MRVVTTATLVADPRTGLPVIVLFTRAPVAGRVKTRLAADIGASAALDVHVELTSRAVEALAGTANVDRALAVEGPLDHPIVGEWARRLGTAPVAQRGADLGARMYQALEDAALSRGVRRPSVLFGSDCPDIDSDYLRAAVAGLVDSDLVIGPAADGGYGLIGAVRARRAWFTDVPWGTSHVAAITRERARGLRVCELPTIYDVDELADLERYRRRMGYALPLPARRGDSDDSS